MARFRGSNWKKSRRLGISLSGTGKELEKRPYAPGQHGPNQRKKLSEYGIQLREKQKLRYLYGITERQFHNTFIEAGKQSGVHGENFMRLLARRLDAVVYALGLARTRRQARQLVSHGHIEVDGGRVNIPSYTLKPGQVVSVREKSQKLDIIQESVEINNYVPEYLDFDEEKLSGTFVRIPERSELPAEINEQLIVEYYSGK
ncbi:30S ribosomal protein S4 [Staphylococcus piscifermentans]|uniref:Small ribosomal subunit protein uS4 n=1 Tax=Staphylococcus piscifermentans TaxID=70258 RepID=A0A239TZY4_9STAP|nr:30S ribosomal protein S4 [Staphylococcus piscifermentans]RTX83628.1 30S ribosomal protein S4 [Staphylococcus piscifermentans]GEP84325.1 30S ribosomal protein S4 [Staphylococcus piscifermentans]SNV03236.1 30S ribosomal protein S4 [Staphylococcus piscifermentans]